jgi:putative membrane protein
MMWDGHEGMGLWMLWGSILWVLFIVAIAVFAARIASEMGRTRERGRQGPSLHEPPLEIARRRYAAGDISREEFEQIKRDLG